MRQLLKKATAWMAAHPGVLAVLVVAMLWITTKIEPNYTDIQSAADANAFRLLLTHPGHALEALGVDVVLAFTYGFLGLLLLRHHRDGNTARSRVLAMSGALVVGAALLDELENAQLLANIARRGQISNPWIDAMSLTGTVKWACIGIAVALVVLLFALIVLRRIWAFVDPRIPNSWKTLVRRLTPSS